MVEGCEETRVLGRNVRANATSKVLDAVGGVTKGEEAVGVWKRHIEWVMNGEGGLKRMGDWKLMRQLVNLDCFDKSSMKEEVV